LYLETYKEKHYDRIVERDKKRNKTPERLAWQRRRLKLWRDKLFDILGRKCVGCGLDSNIALLQFDHINGGGLKDVIRLLGSRSRSYQYYKYYVDRSEEAKEKLQTLCIKCNWIKKFPDLYMHPKWIKSLDRFKRHRILLRHKLIVLIGGWKCVICGDEDKRALQIDHINGGGHKERVKFEFNCDAFNRYYLSHPDEAKSKLRVLCVLCNNKIEDS
jgi:hypothetical protein